MLLKSTEKHLCRSFFINKVADSLQPWNFIIKKNPFSDFTGHGFCPGKKYLEDGLGSVSPPHFANDFSGKMVLMLYSIN